MPKTKKLIIGGDSFFAEVAYELFTQDSKYEVVAFTVEKSFYKKNKLFNLPIIPFEELDSIYNPKDFYFYAAIVYTQLNRVRTKLYRKAKKKGFKLASYISSNAFVWSNSHFGEHCFIFEKNVIQPFVRLGNNVVLWSGNHIGHHSTIKDNVFISSHVVISGLCTIEENCFIGVNASIGDRVKIGTDTVIGAGAVVTKNLESEKVYVGNPSRAIPKSSFEVFNVKIL